MLGLDLSPGAWLALIALASAALWVMSYVDTRWRYRSIPGPVGWPLVGNLPAMVAKDMSGYVLAGEQRFGKIWKWWFGSHPWVVVGDADMATRLLRKYITRPLFPTVLNGEQLEVQDFITIWATGPVWRLARRAFEHAVLSPAVLPTYVRLMDGCAERLVQKLAEAADAGCEVDIHREISKMTLAVVGSAAFGLNLHTMDDSPGSHDKGGAALLEGARLMFKHANPAHGSRWLPLALGFGHLPPLHEAVRWLAGRLPDRNYRLEMAARQHTADLCRELLGRVRSQLEAKAAAETLPAGEEKGGSAGVSSAGGPAGRAAQPAYKAAGGGSSGADDGMRDGSGINGGITSPFLEELLQAKDKVTGVGLTDLQAIAQALTFLLAGYETTANTLAYTVMLLASNPEAQQRLLQEIDAYGRERRPTAAGSADWAEQLPWLDAVVKEALRLWPTAINAVRENPEELQLGGCTIPAGTLLFIPILNLHRSAEYWPRPLDFLPQRWLPEGSDLACRNMNAYMPFGGGARMCVGYKFAQQEARLALLRLYQRFTFTLLPGQLPLAVSTGITMGPAHGIHVKVLPRT